jgi:methionyl-tRNA formyltransferase
MKIAIIAQEEPVCFGPFLREIIEARQDDVVVVAIAGSRGSGSHPRTLRQRLDDLRVHWLIMEPAGFIRSLAIIACQRLIGLLNLTGTRIDRRSIAGAARRHSIPVIHAGDLNGEAFVAELKRYAPDLIINQSERLLKEPILQAAPRGVVNRHASLLPHYRGRLASFRGHAAEPPEYGVTIHFVDQGLDTGPIILQKRLELDPCLPYPLILDLLFRASVPLMLEALDAIERPGFTPRENAYAGTPTWPFPTLAEAREYRKRLAVRRSR